MSEQEGFDLTDKREPPECLTPECRGHMEDVYPVEKEHSDRFVLIRIERSKCHSRARRILAAFMKRRRLPLARGCDIKRSNC